MVAGTAPLSNCLSRAEFWARFVSEVRQRVHEVNAIAEESLWRFSEGADPHPWISVNSVVSNACGVLCAFDPKTGFLLAAPAGYIVADEREWTPRSLAARLLDDLAHADEP